ncbi:MAG: hypothetical protein COB85_00090 [Bacteroidetes bacterium]|nr:MAG: hypothetical protein COB85_00090 [Bacteroidota bacterium]
MIKINQIRQRALLALFLLTTLASHSQNNIQRQLSGTEWIEEMLSCTKKTYTLKNAEIFISHNELESLLASKLGIDDTIVGKDLYDTLLSISNRIIVKSKVNLVNCTFRLKGSFSYFNLYNLSFEKGFYLLMCKIPQGNIGFGNCQFSTLHIWKADFDNRIIINDSEIYNRLFLYQSTFQKLDVYNTIFNDTSSQRSGPRHLLLCVNKVPESSISISNCSFKAVLPYNNPVIFKGNYGKLSLVNCSFEVPINFEDCSANESVTIGQNTTFTYPIGVDRFQFPERHTYFRWESIDEVKLCLYNDYDSPYVAGGDSQLTETFNYYGLTSSYSNFFSMYKTRGDRESANACYVVMKDIETGRLNFLYRQSPTGKKWINWKLNQFLKHFCDYGTSPVKSLIISIYVIFAFACFYFFFYSDWDKISRRFLMNQYRKMLQYFRSEQKLEDFYSDEHREAFRSYEDFKVEIEESKIEIPFFFGVLGKPLYSMSLINYKVMTWIYRRAEILSGRWIDLKPVRKVLVGTAVSSAIIVYLVYLVLIRALNSTVLSINTFSTLGFGDIPVKGVTRYVAILEGFLGWFLLSIFSVSLISQILQN